MIKVKVRSTFSELNGKFFTQGKVRDFIAKNNIKEMYVTPHNMNFYKIEATDYLIHVYDVYEVEK